MSQVLLLFCVIQLIQYVFSLDVNVDYFVDSYTDSSNVFGKVPDPNQSTEWVRYIGEYSSTEECITACVNNGTSTDQCESFTYMTSSYYVNTYKRHCYGLFGKQYGSVWTRMVDQGAVTGRIIYPCKDNTDCSLNGVCSKTTGNCTCNFGWTGYHCGLVNFDSATKGSGYVNINNISSWGGSVLIDDNDSNKDTKYHMYLANFDNHCGVNAWVPNSKVIHAQSTKGFNSPYVQVDIIHQHFSHEPDAIRGPNGEYVLYYAAGNITNGKECECKDGSTPDSCNPGNVPQPFTVLMQYSSSVNGPWSDPIMVVNHATSPCDDPNLSGVILKNGTFIGLVRNWDAGFSSVYPIISDDWKDGSKYKINMNNDIFPQLIGGGTEDQFLYQDCDGFYHGIFNNQSPEGLVSLCGAHAYSTNGIDWVYTGFAFDNNVTWSDGKITTFQRRERPHFVFGDDHCTTIALTNGVQYGGTHGDATYTLLQPLKSD